MGEAVRGMETYFGGPHSLAPIGSDSAITIGTFDGLHRGHARVIEAMMERAHRDGAMPTVVTFEPHPMAALAPERAPKRLTPKEEKRRWLQGMGVGRLIVVPFTLDLSQLTAADFCDWLLDGCCATSLTVGEGFALGHGREGTTDYLIQYGEDHGLAVEIVTGVLHSGAPLSSTRIRLALHEGRVEDASDLLGRLYEVEGGVVHGDGVGRTLGFPTANVDVPPAKLVPGDGVYGGWVATEEGEWRAAISIGNRPTLAGQARVVEAHLIGFTGDLYDEHIRIAFARRVRGQETFDGLETLTEAIARDVAAIEEMDLPSPAWRHASVTESTPEESRSS